MKELATPLAAVRRRIRHEQREVVAVSLGTAEANERGLGHLQDGHNGLKKERRVNLFGAFRLSGLADLRNKKCLLVDDIMTTGATGEEAARILKNAGASQVGLFSIARTELLLSPETSN